MYENSYLAKTISEADADKMIESMIQVLPGTAEMAQLLSDLKYAETAEHQQDVIDQISFYVGTLEHEQSRLFIKYFTENDHANMLTYMTTFINMSKVEKRSELTNLKQFYLDNSSVSGDTVVQKLASVYVGTDLAKAGDMKNLNTLLGTASKIVKDQYTEVTANRFNSVYVEAGNFSKNTKATQYQIDKMYTKLSDAIKNLVKK